MHPNRNIVKDSEQEDLQAQIYGVHDTLRKKFKRTQRSEQNWEDEWIAHTGNIELLNGYAEAMHQLATKIWAPRNSSRTNTCTPDSNTAKIKCRIEWVIIKVREQFTASLAQGTKLRLLDVGSCYNPFGPYSDIMDIVPVDLCPASAFRHVIYQGDFLSIEIVHEELKDGLTSQEITDGTKQLKQLSSNYFDLVVFSFFLEYLPSTTQRFESCQRAFDLLRPGGMLFILRPDSNSATPACMKFIKRLKVGLALIGFKRLYCDKLQHLWAMGFVKLDEDGKLAYITSKKFLTESKLVDYFLDGLDKLFSIPQDSKQFLETVSLDEVSTRITCDPLLFDELPGCDF